MMAPKRREHGEDGRNRLALFREPMARQKWKHVIRADGSSTHVSSLVEEREERVASANDLVLDLVYVVLLSRLGQALRENLDEGENTWCYAHDTQNPGYCSFRTFISLFVPVWIQWVLTTTYLNRFDQNDALHYVFFCLNMLIVAFTGIPLVQCGVNNPEKHCGLFFYAIFAGRLLIVCMYVYTAMWNSAHGRWKFLWCTEIMPGLVTAILYLVTAIVADTGVDHPYVFWGFWWTSISIDCLKLVATGAGVLEAVLGFGEDKCVHVPLNLSLLVERYNLFLVLSLGEVLTAAVGMLPAEMGEGTDIIDVMACKKTLYFTGALVILLGCLLKLLWFDLEEHPEPNHDLRGNAAMMKAHGSHALATSRLRGMLWVVTQLALNMAVVTAGATLEVFTHEACRDSAEHFCGSNALHCTELWHGFSFRLSALQFHGRRRTSRSGTCGS